MNNLLKGSAALSADMAIRFEKASGLSAETLMRVQTARDFAQAREHSDEIIGYSSSESFSARFANAAPRRPSRACL